MLTSLPLPPSLVPCPSVSFDNVMSMFKTMSMQAMEDEPPPDEDDDEDEEEEEEPRPLHVKISNADVHVRGINAWVSSHCYCQSRGCVVSTSSITTATIAATTTTSSGGILGSYYECYYDCFSLLLLPLLVLVLFSVFKFKRF